jgi:effector-binding domain-containing protein
MIRSERELAELARSAPAEVSELELTPLLVGGLRWRGAYADTGRVLGRVCRQFARHADGPPLNLYYDEDYKDDAADIESCLPVRGASEAAGFTLHTLPGGRALTLVHRGPYSDLSRSYSRLMRRFEELRLMPGLPIREIYRKGPGMIFRGNPRTYLTELQIPLRAPA